ncbi:hypothetical protein H5T58_00420, partial [Candidatus Parcubacteria bacterium]|nr:hypothetical protein [Candidatus Parcubacteria bacterium]
EKLEILSEKEKEIENIQEEIKENIKTELKENVEKKIEKEDLPSKEKIVSQIEKTKETIEKEIPIKLKELQKTVEKETKLPSPAIQEQIKKDKEEIKKEIIQDVITPIQQTTKEIPPEEKEKIEPVVSLLKERINNILNEGEIIIREKAKEKAKIDPKALLDSDEDGLYDWDEIRLGTDPFNPDSDRDGYLDGSEIKLKYDPLKPGPADKMVFQDPRKAGKVSEKISVEKVEFAKEDKIIRITGKGIPNSFVTIYIFSSPLIAMVKVNENGFWEYKLDKALSDGTHVVFAAYVNNRGEVEEKSSPLVFVKSGESIVRISEAPAALPPSPVVSLQKSFLVLVLGLMTLALGIAMFIISGLRLKEPK